jgi:nicotinamide-nucleotide amidase
LQRDPDGREETHVIPTSLLAEAEALLSVCREQGILLATAESCTGGLIAAVLTAIAGSSDIFDRGFATYSNAAKCGMVDVPMPLIQTHGEVSEEVARAMAEGALSRSCATIAVSVTGLAGPHDDKPVGLVCFGLAQRGGDVISECHNLCGDRNGIRVAAVAHAFVMIRARIARRFLDPLGKTDD